MSQDNFAFPIYIGVKKLILFLQVPGDGGVGKSLQTFFEIMIIIKNKVPGRWLLQR